MHAVVIPGKTTVHIGGVPVRLAVDTIVETAFENMKHLTGYAYAHIHDDAAMVEKAATEALEGVGTVIVENRQ